MSEHSYTMLHPVKCKLNQTYAATHAATAVNWFSVKLVSNKQGVDTGHISTIDNELGHTTYGRKTKIFIELTMQRIYQRIKECRE